MWLSDEQVQEILDILFEPREEVPTLEDLAPELKEIGLHDRAFGHLNLLLMHAAENTWPRAKDPAFPGFSMNRTSPFGIHRLSHSDLTGTFLATLRDELAAKLKSNRQFPDPVVDYLALGQG